MRRTGAGRSRSAPRRGSGRSGARCPACRRRRRPARAAPRSASCGCWATGRGRSRSRRAPCASRCRARVGRGRQRRQRREARAEDASPIAQSTAVDIRSASQPAIGAITPTASRPGRQQEAGRDLARSAGCSRNGTAGRRRPASGRRTRRSRWRPRARRSRSRSRSTGTSGRGRASSRITSSAPTTRPADGLRRAEQPGAGAGQDVDAAEHQAEGQGVEQRRQPVEPALRELVQRQRPPADRQRGQADRDVDGEQPWPGPERQDAGGHGRADRRRDRDHHGVEADALAQLGVRIDVAHQRAVDAHHAGRAEALQGAGDGQLAIEWESAQASEARVKRISPAR